jgi:ABC-type dipeptide transport system, periplasmic component
MLKRFFLPALLALGVLMFCAGCGDSEPKVQPKAAIKEEAKPQAVKEVTVAIYRDGAMNVLDAATYNGPHFLFKMIYDGLVEDGGGGKILPQLATDWSIAADGKTYTYTLRKNVKFSDGTSFNAEAAVFNLKRWANRGKYAAITASLMESFEAVDEYTLKVVYRDAAYPVLAELTYPRPVRFLSPASISPKEGDVLGVFAIPVGTGPWMLESYEKDKQFSLVPNPHYWGEKPKLDRIVFKVVPDGQARMLALQSGEVDILGGDLMGKIPMSNFLELRKSGKFETFTKGTLCSHFIAFNQNVKPFQDRSVRLAMNYAIDKKSIAEDLFDNMGLEATGMYQKGVPYATAANNYSFGNDKEKSRALLKDAGYADADGDGVLEKDGQKLEFSFLLTAEEFPEWKPLAEFLQAEFASVGIKANLKILDRNGYAQATLTPEARGFDIALMRTASDSWMPHGSMLELFDFTMGKSWNDATLSAMIFKTLKTIDAAERQKGYDDIMAFISEQAITIPVYHPVTTFAVNPEKVVDFAIGGNSYAPVEWLQLAVPQPAQ